MQYYPEKNLFLLPSGKVRKDDIEELTRLLHGWTQH